MLDIEFKLQPSFYCQILFFTLFVASLLILIFMPISLLLKSIAIIINLLYGIYVLYHDVLLQSETAIISLRRIADGRWLLQTKNHKTYEVEIHGESTVTSVVSVLLFRVAKQFRSKACILFTDSLASDDYRKIVVLLKTHA